MSLNNGQNQALNSHSTVISSDITTILATEKQVVKLHSKHYQHLLDEGWEPDWIQDQADKGRIFSVDAEESKQLRFGCKNKEGEWQDAGAGMVFAFTDTFMQIRADNPPENKSGKPAKYLTTCGQEAACYNAGGDWVTEGYKDALIAYYKGGVAVDALAGVSHYKKVYEQGCKKNFIFDSDGRKNHHVIQALVCAGFWTDGKILLLPSSPNFEKVGITEYLKEHTAEEFQQLLLGARSPKDFLFWLANICNDYTPSDVVEEVLRLAGQFLNEIDQARLVAVVVENVEEINKRMCNSLLKAGKERREGKNGKRPPADLLAAELVEELGDSVMFDDTKHRWNSYGRSREGVWEPETVDAMQSVITKMIIDRNYAGYNTNSY